MCGRIARGSNDRRSHMGSHDNSHSCVMVKTMATVAGASCHSYDIGQNKPPSQNMIDGTMGLFLEMPLG